MVRIHGASRRSLLQESLGNSLGKGLSNFTNNYFAGKALDDVINNPEYENGSMSQRSSQLQRAMQPYGEYGAETLKNRMGIEQQVQQEQQQRQQQAIQKKKAPLIAKALKGEELNDQELGLFTPDEQMAIAKHNQVRQAQEQKNNNAELEQEKETAQTAFNEMANLLNKGNLGLGSGIKSSIFGGQTASDVGQFRSLSGALESILVKMVNKGTLSNTRFNYIKDELLPKPTDRDETIKGKMIGLSKILNLDPSSLGIEEENKKPSLQERPGMVQMKDPQGVNRWVPEDIAKQMQGSK
jgi:hypothetical protein